MNSPTLKKTALAALVAGTLAGATVPTAYANVVNVSFKGAFTMLNPSTAYVRNSPSDYANGFYGVTGTAHGATTQYGWKGARTPITGTMSFDTSTGAGVATVNPFLFFGDTNNEYWDTPAMSFQLIDTVGTLVGGMVFSWHGGSHLASIVMDAGQMFAALPTMIGSGPTTTVSGTYSALSNGGGSQNTGLPSSDDITTAIIRTNTLNTGAGCDGLTLATQVNAYTINTNFVHVSVCTTGMINDGAPGDPMTSPAFSDFFPNFDILSVHLDSYVPTPTPVPAAFWLFGSGLLGLFGIAKRRRQ